MPDARYLIDLTTSRQYKGHNPVGIVRTEREIAKAFLLSGCEIGFFHFDLKLTKFLMISRQEATAILGGTLIDEHLTVKARSLEIREPSTAEQDEVLLFLNKVRKRLSASPLVREIGSDVDPGMEREVEFFGGDVIISAGLLWDGSFLQQLYSLKQKIALRVIQVVYDIVPIIVPEFCVPGMNVRFPKFIVDAAWTADEVYCISDSTMSDLDAYIRKHELPMPSLRRISLGANLAHEHDDESPSALRNELTQGDFVVYVSTIEPRKNHATLFHVWRQLFQTDRDVLIPLVIVGRQGWNSGDLITMMQAAEHISPDYLKIMTEVSDAELDWLYRNSRFTVYPSFYEGWGLPVAESLARGKYCIAADASSIPEVAAGFAELIDPLDLPAWTRAIRRCLRTPDDVKTAEIRIKEGYEMVSWKKAMADFVASVTADRVAENVSLLEAMDH